MLPISVTVACQSVVTCKVSTLSSCVCVVCQTTTHSTNCELILMSLFYKYGPSAALIKLVTLIWMYLFTKTLGAVGFICC